MWRYAVNTEMLRILYRPMQQFERMQNLYLTFKLWSQRCTKLEDVVCLFWYTQYTGCAKSRSTEIMLRFEGKHYLTEELVPVHVKCALNMVNKNVNSFCISQLPFPAGDGF
jgi:hypothetical protein